MAAKQRPKMACKRAQNVAGVVAQSVLLHTQHHHCSVVSKKGINTPNKGTTTIPNVSQVYKANVPCKMGICSYMAMKRESRERI